VLLARPAPRHRNARADSAAAPPRARRSRSADAAGAAAAGCAAPQIQRLPGSRTSSSTTQQRCQPVRRSRLDVREGDMRKLQFAGEACVLDVFLYPLRDGAEPVATHVEARRASDGQDVDRAACVRALRR
jgi:hypothetical protein